MPQPRYRLVDTETTSYYPCISSCMRRAEESNTVDIAIPIQQTDYFALVDWTGRAIRADKAGAMPASVKPILQKLSVEQSNWVRNTRYFGCRFGRVLGRIDQISSFAHRLDQIWLGEITQAKAFYHQQIHNQPSALHQPLLAERQLRFE